MILNSSQYRAGTISSWEATPTARPIGMSIAFMRRPSSATTPLPRFTANQIGMSPMPSHSGSCMSAVTHSGGGTPMASACPDPNCDEAWPTAAPTPVDTAKS